MKSSDMRPVMDAKLLMSTISYSVKLVILMQGLEVSHMVFLPEVSAIISKEMV